LRTLIFHPALAPYRIDLFNHLARRLELRLVLLNRAPSYGAYNQQALENRLECDYQFLPAPMRVLTSEIRRGVLQSVRRFRPQVICTSEFADLTPRMILMRRSGVLADFGHVLWTDESPAMQDARGSIRSWLRRIRCGYVDSMIVCSPTARQGFARRGWMSQEAIFVCGVHQSAETVQAKLQAGRRITADVLRHYGLWGRKIVLFIGRLVEEKDPLVLLNAFVRTRAAHPDAVLVYVGCGPMEASLTERAAAFGLTASDVLFTGHLEDAELYVWYAVGSVLVRPSLVEPYGAVINEALLCGLPVLCSSAVGACGLICQGWNGHLFEPRDINALTALLDESLRYSSSAEILAEQRRENLMPVSFSDDVDSFVEAVHYAWSSRCSKKPALLPPE
jgi:glycosyltransferase involved in cell wall biosynthesis